MEKLVQAVTFSIVFSPFFFLMLVFTSYKPSKNKSIKKHIQEEYIQKPLKSIGFLLLIILLMTITLYTML